jgi:hypothetical protein
MKKNFLCAMLTMVLAFSVGCQSLDEELEPMKVAVVDEHFSISVPEDYEETSSEYIEKYYVKDDCASIIVTHEDSTESYSDVSQYYDYATLQYTATFDNFEEISKSYTTIQNQYNTIVVEFSYSVSSIDMTCYAEYILLGSTIYVVTCSSTTDTYSQYRDGFEQSLESVSIS